MNSGGQSKELFGGRSIEIRIKIAFMMENLHQEIYYGKKSVMAPNHVFAHQLFFTSSSRQDTTGGGCISQYSYSVILDIESMWKVAIRQPVGGGVMGGGGGGRGRGGITGGISDGRSPVCLFSA